MNKAAKCNDGLAWVEVQTEVGNESYLKWVCLITFFLIIGF